MDEITIAGNTVLRIYVPESSPVHRCSGRIFDRNEDGDLDITDHTRQVSALYQRKQETYSENKIYPYAGLTDLRDDLIKKARKVAGIQRKDHPWMGMSDLELLKSAQLHQTDYQSGKDGKVYGGRDPQLVEGDIFRTNIAVPESDEDSRVKGGTKSGAQSGVESGVESEMALRILGELQKRVLSKSEIAKTLGKRKPTRYLNDLMANLLKNEMVVFTIPDKPNSRLQKYRLTIKGRMVLKAKKTDV